jgi:putative nucleotidyltransferase with HDIG domain
VDTYVTRDRKSLSKSAPERIREELLKMFETPNAHTQLVAMENAGLLEVFFKEAIALRKTAPKHYGKGGVLKHTLDSVKHFELVVASLKSWFPWAHKKINSYLSESYAGYSRRAHGKWALLLHDIGKPATEEFRDGRLRFFEHEHVGAEAVIKLATRFRWSGEETSRYARLVRNHMRPGNLAAHGAVTDKAIHRFFRDLEDDAISMLLVSLADHLTYLSPKQFKKT